MRNQAKDQKAFIAEIHRAINFADDKFQRSRFSEFKRVFGMLHGALFSGGITYDLYIELYREVWDCRFAVEVVDLEDPEQAKMDFGPEEDDDEEEEDPERPVDLSAFEVEISE